MLASSVAVPPTMASNAPPPPPPRYVVTPTPAPAPPVQSFPTLLSTQVSQQPQLQPQPPPQMPAYAPPPQPMGMMPPSYPYPMMIQQPQQATGGTPGLAVASLVCGLLGWIPLWIGFILCLLAITFGTIVLASSKPGQQGRGLAIAGLVCGLILLLPAACGL